LKSQLFGTQPNILLSTITLAVNGLPGILDYVSITDNKSLIKFFADLTTIKSLEGSLKII
jgi:hypothetical protein